MSEQSTETKPLDPEVAYSNVQSRVYTPVFFEKLASDYGVTPQNDEEAMDMLAMAAGIRQSYDDQSQQSNGSLIKQARAYLEQYVNSQPQNSPFADDAVKEAAARGSFDPELAHSILSLHTAASQQQN